jgi:hypothetical protein
MTELNLETCLLTYGKFRVNKETDEPLRKAAEDLFQRKLLHKAALPCGSFSYALTPEGRRYMEKKHERR